MTHPATRPGRTLHHRPWRHGSDLALLTPTCRGATAAEVRSAAAEAVASGFHAVLSPALEVSRTSEWLAAGFVPHERLHLLHHDLTSAPDRAAVRLRPAVRWDRPRVLAIDEAAFDDPFWHLDGLGLADALRATQQRRYRIDLRRRGFAISGTADSRAYLQRLAVDPLAQGQGLGASLVVDAISWARAVGAQRLSVNTQEHNAAALSLYRNLGFVADPDGLTVLRWDATS